MGGSGGSGTTLRSGWADQGILGQPSAATASPRDVRRVMSLPPHVKLPKSPRPERAVMVTASVVRGLRDTVDVTKQDLATLHQAQRDYQLSLVSNLLQNKFCKLKKLKYYSYVIS